MRFIIYLVFLSFIYSIPLIAVEDKIKSLDLSGNTITDLKEIVRRYPDLQELSLANSRIDHLEPLLSLSDLRVLDLSGCACLNDDSLATLAELKNLEVLSLEKLAQLTDRGLSHLSTCPKLKYLDLSWNTGFSDASLKPLPPSLKVLSLLRCSQLNDLKNLAHLPQLKSLDLSHCSQLREEALQDLLHLKIRHLYLWNWGQLTDHGLKLIGQMDSLTKLDISYCPQITDDGLIELASLTDLQNISLSHNFRITDNGIKHFMDRHPHLKSIDLHGCFQISQETREKLKNASK
ncbi:MAG: hypothetical protein LLG04_12655 [Parachlamydia sp.]|nr:hypothetical protein [Parachlamydia sp.]